MSEGGSSTSRVLVDLVLPGVSHLRAGRTGVGSAVTALWLALLGSGVWRSERLLPFLLEGAWDERLAVATWLVSLVVLWMLGRGSGDPDARGGLGRSLVGPLTRARGSALGLGFVTVLALVAVLTPLLAPFDPNAQGSLVAERFLGPSLLHPMGTDNLARDVLSRLLYGARISLAVGFLAVGISVSIGTLLGAVAGYVGGALDSVIMRGVDIVLAFPRLVLLIAIVAVLEPTIPVIVCVLGLTMWPSTARLVRGEVLSLREREFVLAARALGFPRRRIVLRHLVPNALGPVIVAAALGIGDTIILEAGLSFLGLGVQAPTPSWGSMVDAGRVNLLDAWWISTFPGLAIVATVMAFNLLGDGLRDVLDPRTRS